MPSKQTLHGRLVGRRGNVYWQLAKHTGDFSEYFTWQLHVVHVDHCANHLPCSLEAC